VPKHRVPLGCRSRPEGLVQRTQRAGPAGVGQVELDTVGEPEVPGRVYGDQVELTFERPTCRAEQVPVHRREGQRRRARVEREAVPGVRTDLSADGRGLLEHRDRVTEVRESSGGD
jgi:hypothetical protein